MTQGEGDPWGFGGGSGQGGALGFRYRLRGWKWTWDSKTGDPRTWTGHGDYYDLAASGYTYGSNADALAAGKAVGDSNPAVIDIYVECDTPGFAGAYYAYTQRDQDAKNAPSKESNAAYEEYIKEGKLELPQPSTASPFLGLIVIGLIIVVILWGLPKLYKGAPNVVAEVKEVV
jgi:hypothetical protein